MSDFSEMVAHMQWRKISHEVPSLHEPLYYYFEKVGVWKGEYQGIYTDEDGIEWENCHMFVSECGNYWLTGDVTHWQPDFGQEKPNPPIKLKERIDEAVS